MNFIDSVSTCIKKSFKFSGRASRSEYWNFYLFQVILVLIPSIFPELLNKDIEKENILFYLIGLIILLLIPPYISVLVRRLHDTNRSGWWALIQFIPLLGALIIIILCCLPGTKGINKYGYLDVKE